MEKLYLKNKIFLILLVISVILLTALSLDAREAGTMLKLYVNNEEISVAWEDNESVQVLMELASKKSIIIEMSMYGGFEQVGSIGQNLPRNDKRTTTHAGDIVLYSGNQVVVFYGSNSWSYTRLGKIQNKTDKELENLLGNGNVTIIIKAE